MNLLYAICPNGYGHLKRAISISEALVQEDECTKITFFLCHKTARYFQESTSKILRLHSKTIFFPNEWGLSLQNLLLPDFEHNFFSWLIRLEELIEEFEFDLVLSDNLCSPGALTDKIVLTGCFLWHDILERTSANAKVLEFEKQQLEMRKPVMIHVEQLGMPEVLAKTTAKAVPWITERFHLPRSLGGPARILVTAGKSGQDYSLFLAIAKLLVQKTQYEVFVNQDMKKDMPTDPSSIFDFSPASFANLSLIIGRPGIGILTDVVKYQIPILTHDNFDNKELRFNAGKVDQLRLGMQGNLLQTTTLLEHVDALVHEGPTRKSILDTIRTQELGGSQIAAQIILEQL